VEQPVSTPTPLSAAAVNLPGKWNFRAETGEKPIVGTLTFWFDNASLRGTYTGLRGNSTALWNLRVTGAIIAFDLVAARGTWHLDGTVAGATMSGTFQSASRTIRWTATKIEAPATTPPGP
jgi:hypothetical protein